MEVEPSLYAILGVDPRATAEEIRRAFRQLARSQHPDASVGSVRDSSRFRQIRQAYEVLSDPSARRDYDASLDGRRTPGGRRIEVRTVAGPRGQSTGRRRLVCVTCGGTGAVTDVLRCPGCDSTGTIVRIELHRAVRQACPTCGGAGRVRRSVACPSCGRSDDSG